MNSYFRPVISGVLLCVAHLSAAAQTRNEWSVQGSWLYSGLGGSPYEGIEPGRGFEVQGRKKINQFWSVGCGVQGTHHTMKSSSGKETLQGLFCEPRRLVDINSEHFFPYLSGRAAHPESASHERRRDAQRAGLHGQHRNGDPDADHQPRQLSGTIRDRSERRLHGVRRFHHHRSAAPRSKRRTQAAVDGTTWFELGSPSDCRGATRRGSRLGADQPTTFGQLGDRLLRRLQAALESFDGVVAHVADANRRVGELSVAASHGKAAC